MSLKVDWDFPYASQRAPVIARNVVASSQPLATQAGIQMLQAGGNAVDAALATAIALTVVEPCSNGLGSDAFAIIGKGNRIVGINGSGRSPSGWSAERFQKYSEMPRTGWDTVTVPGAVSVWVELAKTHGRLPFKSLFEPAIRYAAEGFHVGHKTATAWQSTVDRMHEFPNFLDHFLIDGAAPQPGQLCKRPHMHKTLATIAESNGEDFYRGDLATQMVEQSISEGGCLTLADLAAHEANWVDTISHRYGEIEVHEIPPNGQGLAALVALAILDELNIRESTINSTDWIHLQVEAMKIAIRSSFEHLADPDSMRVNPTELLDPKWIQRAAKTVTKQASVQPAPILPKSSDTVYLCACDETGMMVSFIQSNYQGFGSGVVIKDTGIVMQNRGAGFVLEEAHPNVVGPRKRPFHTIIPGFVSKSGQSLMAFGVMGGHMQHQGHVQMITRIFDHHENPQAASDAPRWHVTPDFRLVLEKGFSIDVITELKARGHDIVLGHDENLFGGAQLILKHDEHGYVAASDHRKEGCAAGV